ncbi:MAG: hypothetical protein JWR09_3462 [Mucilaginibacter sp.]|nr:hypothetical protein [Mucilaginibacter sp.]
MIPGMLNVFDMNLPAHKYILGQDKLFLYIICTPDRHRYGIISYIFIKNIRRQVAHQRIRVKLVVRPDVIMNDEFPVFHCI